MSQVHHDAAFDIALPHIVEDGVDVFQLAGLDGGLDLAVGCKIERFLQIKPRPHDGAAHRYAIEHHVEDGKREIARRQAIQRNSTAARNHAQRLFKSLGRNRRHQHALRTAIGFLANIGCRVGNRLSVDRNGCAKSAGEIELAVVNIDGGNIQPHGPGILHSHVAEPAYA